MPYFALLSVKVLLMRFSTQDGGFQYVKKARVVVYIENEEAA